jgi:Cu(I)/Ag(I) efflux system membrane protein CusA/SilA
MTVSAILFGLLPIMWSPATQAGADVMKRIATPMIGGVITSAILELLILSCDLRTLAEALIGWLMIQG